MNSRRTLGGAVVLQLLLSLVFVGAARGATPTQLTRLSISPGGASLVRTQVQYETVSLTLVDPDGIPSVRGYFGDQGITCPCVVMQNQNVVEPRSRALRLVTLRLASGTASDGVWVGSFAVGAADAGFWRASVMQAGDIHAPPENFGNSLAPTPAPWGTVTLNVHGYDWPRIWLGTPVPAAAGGQVAVGQPVVMRGGAALSRSYAAVGGVRLELRGEYCDFAAAPNLVLATTRTDSAGRYTFAFTFQGSAHVCAAMFIYPTDARDNIVAMSNVRN